MADEPEIVTPTMPVTPSAATRDEKGGAKKGGRRRGGRLNLAALRAQARRETNQQIALMQQQLAALERGYQQQLATQVANQRAYYAQIAQQLAPIAGQVEGIVNRQTQATTGFAQGFSQTMKQLADQSAGQASDYVAQSGMPGGVESQGTPQANALYGEFGYVPAVGLSNYGAAQAAAAAMLPGTARLQGEQAIARLQQQYRDQVLREIQAKRMEVASQRPGLYSDIYGDLFNQEFSLAQFDFAREQFGEEKRQAGQKAQFDAIKYQDYLAEKERQFSLQLARLGISQGHLDIAGQNLALRAAELDSRLKGKGKKKKFTALQVQDFRGQSHSLAEDFYEGISEDEVDDPSQAMEPQAYQAAIQAGLRAGIPLSILLPILNRYYAPGERGRPGPRISQSNYPR